MDRGEITTGVGPNGFMRTGGMDTARATRKASSTGGVRVSSKRIEIQGFVQGVGFRPFVFNLARKLELNGFIENNGRGVQIEVEGISRKVNQFIAQLRADHPPLATIDHVRTSDVPRKYRSSFTIRGSACVGEMTSLVMPDVAMCSDCLRDILDPENRRYGYPFTNCTNCGPRYSIINSMPYDRLRTSMAGFEMCSDCRAEYEDPTDRRFHAQPIACPRCGPHIELWAQDGGVMAEKETALARVVEALHGGKIVALKGLGGFQLLADARNDEAVSLLRERKRREGKPFALMCPDLPSVRAHCFVTAAHAEILSSPQSPIVLMPSRPGNTSIALSVAPDTYMLGVMLPYTPLHQLLLAAVGGPIVVTSANLGEEPICIDEGEALERLSGIADLFLMHNRPIVRQVDDSVVTVIDGQPMMLRRARGYAPAPLPGTAGLDGVAALGGHMKSTLCLSRLGVLFPSQHIGDLGNIPAQEAFHKTYHSLKKLLQFEPKRIVHDLHPDYASTRYALREGLPTVGLQHHFAHVLSCMAEHGMEGPVLGVSWDGTGYGSDGTLWGGEFLCCTREGFERVAHIRPFRLPGGDVAIREPRRAAIGILQEIYGAAMESLRDLPTINTMAPRECRNIQAMLVNEINSPVTTSMGRLFDAVASLCGLCQTSAFEGQAAMRLERAAFQCTEKACVFDFELYRPHGRLILDWKPLIEQVLDALRAHVSVNAIARGFHNALAKGVVQIAQEMSMDDVVLTGGCFQNAVLSEVTTEALRKSGFKVYCHRAVPPNDGGLSIGQAWYRSAGVSIPCV